MANNIDKNQAIIDFLMTCPLIRDNPLFFNFIEASEDNKQILTLANEKNLNKQFIDGSVLKRYTFTIVDFKAMMPKPIVEGLVDENVDNMLQVQEIIDWVTEQADEHNYPDFGEDCSIDDMRALSDNPNLNGVDSNVTPALAKYSVSIQIDYLDTSKVTWNN